MSPFKKRKSIIYLPEELMMDVWLRLPIKSTVRFRCVSKSWYAYLSDPRFIYKNLTLPDAAQNQNENDHLLVLDEEGKYYSVVSQEPLLAATPLQLSPLLNVPAADEHRRDIATHCCDDLVCFHSEYGEVIGVWNLTTGETKTLPSLHNSQWAVVVGFGFDDKTKDYKIVQIARYRDGNPAYVYSLRTGNNVWRKLDEPNVPNITLGFPIPADFYCCSYRDGVFYWCDLLSGILSFDMRSEVFNRISFPGEAYPLSEDVVFQWERIWKLKGESMLLVTCTVDEEDVYVYDLWAFLDIGVSSSLTKLFNIDWHYENKQLWLPLGFWRNELVFKLYGKGLVMGNPSEEPSSLKVVEIDGPLDIVSCSVWTKGKNSVAALN